jgi:hypothetical protein
MRERASGGWEKVGETADPPSPQTKAPSPVMALPTIRFCI